MRKLPVIVVVAIAAAAMAGERVELLPGSDAKQAGAVLDNGVRISAEFSPGDDYGGLLIVRPGYGIPERKLGLDAIAREVLRQSIQDACYEAGGVGRGDERFVEQPRAFYWLDAGSLIGHCDLDDHRAFLERLVEVLRADRLSTAAYARAFDDLLSPEWSPLDREDADGHRLAILWREGHRALLERDRFTFSSVSLEDVRDYLRSWLAPENIGFSVFTTLDAIDEVRQTAAAFRNLKKRAGSSIHTNRESRPGPTRLALADSRDRAVVVFVPWRYAGAESRSLLGALLGPAHRHCDVPGQRRASCEIDLVDDDFFGCETVIAFTFRSDDYVVDDVFEEEFTVIYALIEEAFEKFRDAGVLPDPLETDLEKRLYCEATEPKPAFDPGYGLGSLLDPDEREVYLLIDERLADAGVEQASRRELKGEMRRGLDLVDRGMAEEALWRFDRIAHALSDFPLPHLLRAVALAELDRGEEALTAARRALALNPTLPPAMLAEAQILLDEMNDPRAALSSVGGLLELDEGHFEATLLEARAHAAASNLAGARDTLERLVEYAPDDADAWLHLADFLAETAKDPLGAALAYARAVVEGEDADAVASRLVNALKEAGGSVEVLRVVAEIDYLPESDFWEEVGDAINDETEAYELAVEAYHLALESDPDDEAIWGSLGNSYVNMGRADEALDALHRALDLDPDYGWVWRRLGDAHGALLEDWEAAASAYREAIRCSSDDTVAWRKLGGVLLQLDRAEEALAALDRAVELDPTGFLAISMRGDALKSLDRIDEAIDAYREAVELDPDRPWAWADLAVTLAAAGRDAEASAAHGKALLTHRRALAGAGTDRERAFHLNETAWYIAAVFETTDPDLLAEALEYAREACRLTNRESVALLDTLAEVHFRMGDRDRALEVIEEALAVGPEDVDCGPGDLEYLEEQRERFLEDPAR